MSDDKATITEDLAEAEDLAEVLELAQRIRPRRDGAFLRLCQLPAWEPLRHDYRVRLVGTLVTAGRKRATVIAESSPKETLQEVIGELRALCLAKLREQEGSGCGELRRVRRRERGELDERAREAGHPLGGL